MKVIFSRKARRDLGDVGHYLISQNPRRALSYLEELQKACDELAEMSASFAELQSPYLSGLRRRVYRNYSIFYRVDHATVRIVRILHGARNYPRILSQA